MTLSQEAVGLTAGILTAASMLPQLIKTIKKKEVEDLSYLIFILLIVGTGLWAYYGFIKNDLPIIITNIFSCSINCAMLVLKIKYAK